MSNVIIHGVYNCTEYDDYLVILNSNPDITSYYFTNDIKSPPEKNTLCKTPTESVARFMRRFKYIKISKCLTE
jgi:hypothetical protein